MNIFKEFFLSIYSYGSYRKFIWNRRGKVFCFGLLLALLYFVATMLVPAMINVGSPSTFAQNFRDAVPDFELRNGTLWVEDVIELDEAGMYIYIDTNSDYVFYDAEDMEQYLYGYSQVLLMDSEKMVVKNNGVVQDMYYYELGLEIDREAVAAFIPKIYVITMVIIFLWMALTFFFGVLFVALLGMIASSIMHYRIPFGQLYVLGVYSRTLPLILKAVVNDLSLHIPFFWVINFGLSLFIIVMAIQKMEAYEVSQTGGFDSSGFDM